MLRYRTMAAAVAIVVSMVSLSTAAEHTKDSLATVKKNVDEEKAVLVDIREKSEWDEGHIENAVFLPLSALRDGVNAKELAKRLPKDKILYTYCVVGKRALTAGNIIEKFGYKVRPLKPGYKDLLRAGFKKATE